MTAPTKKKVQTATGATQLEYLADYHINAVDMLGVHVHGGQERVVQDEHGSLQRLPQHVAQRRAEHGDLGGQPLVGVVQLAVHAAGDGALAYVPDEI